MNAATNEYLIQKFGGYYNSPAFLSALEIPTNLEQREWGFIFFDAGDKKGMKRHTSFSTKDEVSNYIRSMNPRHVYYSTAYYSLPSAGTMQEKGWLGAELIFDLDADHIVRTAYDEMLRRVKEETFKIIDMLTCELGFTQDDIHLVFSGGRGYHVHIEMPEVRGWGSSERRELVDYVCGIGLDPEIMLTGRGGTDKGKGAGHAGRINAANSPTPANVHSWHYRYRLALLEYLTVLKHMKEEDAVDKLAAIKGISKDSAKEFVEKSLTPTITKLKKPESTIILSKSNRVLKTILTADDSDFPTVLRGKAALTDEPVTTDVKRLIRAPGSLHGGSGFKVVSVDVKALDKFDPLIDPVCFGTKETKIDLMFPLKMPLLGNNYSLVKGINTVPEAMAIFLCARGIAEYVGGK